jgi:hypothetical protein
MRAHCGEHGHLAVHVSEAGGLLVAGVEVGSKSCLANEFICTAGPSRFRISKEAVRHAHAGELRSARCSLHPPAS